MGSVKLLKNNIFEVKAQRITHVTSLVQSIKFANNFDPRIRRQLGDN